MGAHDQAEPVQETCSVLRGSQEDLDIFNVSAGWFCVVELVRVAASRLVKSDGCVSSEG